MMTKIFITGSKEIDKLSLAKKIISKDDDLSISQTFTNEEEYKDSVGDDYMYYLDPKDIDLAYKNNAFLYISAHDLLYHGITLDSFYNEDIFCMNLSEFNDIPDYIFNYNDVLVIWLDTKSKKRNIKDEDVMASKYMIEKLDKINVMYFLDEDYDDIVDVIMQYLMGDPDTRQKLLDENY